MKKPEALVHGLGLLTLLFILGWWTEYLFLEVAIVIILMYEIGFDIPVMQKLMDLNYDTIAGLKKLFKPARKGIRRGKIKRRVDSNTQGV